MHYRKEIDGLRSVAVLPVILFHAGFSVFSGGFVGVDVFFVISGYLITSVLISELAKGTFSIAGFYERRARRILPALFVVMLACIPFAYMWMLPAQLIEFFHSVIAVVFSVSNILFWREDGYFAEAAELKPLLHTWSLAVEEQYYLLFPLFLMAFWRIGRSRVLWCIIIIAILSLLVAEWGWRNSPSANFYLAPTRAWELLAGSICAFLLFGRAQYSNNLLSALGLALILFATFFYDHDTPFPSVYALAPVGGTALIIMFAAPQTWTARLLSLPPLVGIGLISYSAYLWHQPLFAFARLRALTKPDDMLMLGLCVLTFVLAWLSWRYVEQPFRRRPTPFIATRRNLFAASAIAGAVFVAVGIAGHFGQGFENRDNGEISFGALGEKVAINHGLHEDCEGVFNDSANCKTANAPNVLLWGDSFAMHLAQGLTASEPGLALQQHTTSSCAPILGVAQKTGSTTKQWADNCMSFNDSVLNWLSETPSVDIVVLSSLFTTLDANTLVTQEGDTLTGDNMEFVAQRLRDTVASVRETGARVIIVSPTPASGWDIGQCLIRSTFYKMDEASCDFALNTKTPQFKLLESVAETVPVHLLYDDICTDNTCDAMQDDVLIYRDTGHLSKEGSAYLGQSRNWMTQFRELAR